MRIEGGSKVVPRWFRCQPGRRISFFEKSKMTLGNQDQGLVPTWCLVGANIMPDLQAKLLTFSPKNVDLRSPEGYSPSVQNLNGVIYRIGIFSSRKENFFVIIGPG
jgi:hypothetical protein